MIQKLTHKKLTQKTFFISILLYPQNSRKKLFNHLIKSFHRLVLNDSFYNQLLTLFFVRLDLCWPMDSKSRNLEVNIVVVIVVTIVVVIGVTILVVIGLF